MRKSWKWVPLTLALLLLAALWLRGGSERRAERFVRQYGVEIAESWQRNGAIPERGQRYVNEWPGEHPMLELLLTAGPGGYSGCYYSPDGVPPAAGPGRPKATTTARPGTSRGIGSASRQTSEGGKKRSMPALARCRALLALHP